MSTGSDHYKFLSQLLGQEDKNGSSAFPVPLQGALPVPYTPLTPVEIPRRQLEAIERMDRKTALTSMAALEAAAASNWLTHRYPHELGFTIEYRAESTQRAFLFGRGEEMRARLDVHIWRG